MLPAVGKGHSSPAAGGGWGGREEVQAGLPRSTGAGLTPAGRLGPPVRKAQH